MSDDDIKEQICAFTSLLVFLLVKKINAVLTSAHQKQPEANQLSW